MQNLTELRLELTDLYYKTKEKQITLGMCKELTNTAGKIIGAVRTQLAYNIFHGIKDPIDFLVDKKPADKIIALPDHKVQQLKAAHSKKKAK